MQILAVLLASLALVVGFQNCSNSNDNDPGFFVTEEPWEFSYNCDPGDRDCIEQFASQDCYPGATTCLAPEQALWIKIKESNPYRINLATQQNVADRFTVGGTCGTSSFLRHRVKWVLSRNSGNQDVVARDEEDDICINGRFSLVVVAPLTAGLTMALDIELVGVRENDSEVSNSLPNNKSRVTVVIVNQPR